ncbi:hypothetical protein PHLCEN_2v12559 [Hermanssonia centrifuga]|uniref:NADH dehydrogenase n=1 Tax=Hermanssonia centrifuga TaxID=98765 RepID=A0A2R6NGN4_9APHY|nr:hypothetical protein PHLCEN_2v12559 [Hermanssonia centrifuga]
MIRVPKHRMRPCSSLRVTRNFTSSSARSQQRLVILGSGWGGYEVLRGVDKERWKCISGLV